MSLLLYRVRISSSKLSQRVGDSRSVFVVVLILTAGKSSLALALLRMIPTEGKVVIVSLNLFLRPEPNRVEPLLTISSTLSPRSTGWDGLDQGQPLRAQVDHYDRELPVFTSLCSQSRLSETELARLPLTDPSRPRPPLWLASIQRQPFSHPCTSSKATSDPSFLLQLDPDGSIEDAALNDAWVHFYILIPFSETGLTLLSASV